MVLRKKRVNVTDEDFVTAWVGSKTLAEVAETTGMGIPGCRLRAMVLRKAGVGLKKFTRTPRVVDVKGLNALVKELEKKQKA
jgi:hypothetical protein